MSRRGKYWNNALTERPSEASKQSGCQGVRLQGYL